MIGQLREGQETHQGADSAIVERAGSLASRLAERAREADKTRRLSPDTVMDFQESGLLTTYIPAEYGGLEADFHTNMRIAEILGGACASSAWCWLNHSASVALLRGILKERSRPVVQEAARDGAVIAHAQVPSGDTRPAAGGFVASGRWPFVSFSNYARWAFLSTMVAGPPPGWQPTVDGSNPPSRHNRWLLLELDRPGVHIEDTWHAMSLRASMSNDVVLDEVFIPEELAPVFVRPSPETVLIPDDPPALRLPYSHLRALVGGLALGIAQAALSDTIEYATTRPMTVGGQLKSRMPGNQFAVADAAVAIESARAFLYQGVGQLMSKAGHGEQFVPADVIGLQMALLAARENAEKAVDRLFSLQGAHGLYETGNFERYYRDVRTFTLHAIFAPDLERELIGKHLFGVPADVRPRWG